MTGSATVQRFRFSRAGILNVWQYDDQVFTFGGGRMLLRGTNGAGKSKTLEMLLPFVLDGDKARMTASGRHHTSLLWLMTDGYEGASRTGYLWVEFLRPGDDGEQITLTCGVGIRASESSRQASAWFFTSPHRVGQGLLLEDENGPLSLQRCRAAVEGDGHFFDSAPRYRDHVGHLLFGLPPDQYAELLRLLYWLRQPQVGEDIEPRRLADQLVQALPQVDDGAVRAAGDTFDELEAFGEQIDRRDRAALAVADFVQTYAEYARGVLQARAQTVVDADRAMRQRQAELRRSQRALEQVSGELGDRRVTLSDVMTEQDSTRSRLGELEKGPEARAQQRLMELGRRAEDLEAAGLRMMGVADAAATRSERSAARAERARAALAAESSRVHGDLGETAEALARVGLIGRLAVPSELASLGADGQAAQVTALVDRAATGVRDCRPGLGELRAAVLVVEGARREMESSRQLASIAAERAAEVESRAERAGHEHDAAAGRSRAAQDELRGQLEAWQQDGHAVELVVPELTADGLARLEGVARAAAGPVRAGHEEALGVALALVRQGAERRATLQGERARVDAEVDPLPPPPPWSREDRAGLAGAPLWRLVDFRGWLDEDERAGLEAALDGAGLLDAWVHPDGRVDAERDDVALVLGPTAAGMTPAGSGPAGFEQGLPAGSPQVRPAARTLAEALRADVVEDGAVSAVVVTRLLERVGLGGGGSSDPVEPGAREPAVSVSTDGRWSAGPLRGRTRKERAQYVGATARAAERDRRLARVDHELERVAQEMERARGERDQASARVHELDAWLAARPRHEAMLRAWSELAAAEAAVALIATELKAAQARATTARSVAAGRLAELERLATGHGLPTTAVALAARTEQLNEITARLDRHESRLVDLSRRGQDWAEQVELSEGDRRDVMLSRQSAAEATTLATRVSAKHHEMRSALGASVLELERRLTALRGQLTAMSAGQAELQREVERLSEAMGTTRAQVQTHQAALAETAPRLEAARSGFAALVDVPGLVRAGLPPGDGVSLPTGRDLAQAEPSAARAVLELGGPMRQADANAVLAAARDLQSGPAATLEPRVVEVAGALAAVGRDDAGEQPLVDLSDRLRTSVDADRALLTDRERRLFEDHVLGHLGDSLRQVRLKAEELVVAMNELLHGVTTSQGIRVRLRWRLRDDLPPEARRAVQLLGEPAGALLPDERRDLRESLHRLIEVSRVEAPEDSYADHLARALDYRQWFAFRIQYHRPETGEWADLHRRSPLSQGEQKVLCYLPLFAAAAAHFTSIAGAAPYAPRFVLLDDAFPKIDVRTHPLLFGLLVDLDLDFLITSERLWGDHATVPELAIYEALRSPAERGIAQYEHRWDGHQLTAVGA